MTEPDPIREVKEATASAGMGGSTRSRVLVGLACYNEGVKIDRTLSRFPKDRLYDVLVLNDGSTDDTIERIQKFPNVDVVSHPRNRGVGAALRTINQYALDNGYDIVINMAGNDKDDPMLIPRLLQPMFDEACDYVQGSRYLKGGAYGNMPLHRVFATRVVHPLLFSLITRRRITDSTNGFRAYRTTLLRDPRINLEQDWLDKYELEPYFFYKAITLGYKVKEVPVTKIYPPHALRYTKMKPITGWWSILRPIFLLGLRIKK